MDRIETILKNAKTIAVVGLSPKPERASYGVANYLISKGYTIIPVNPVYDEIMNLKSYSSLSDIPSNIKIDIVDVFRKAEDTPPLAREAVKIKAPCLWLQLGIANEESEKIALEAGIDFIQNRCIKIEHNRYIG
jgi:predicted CoA-binding protein